MLYRTKRKKRAALCALFASLAWTQAHAEGRIEAVIRETTRAIGSEPVRVDVTFINRGDAPVFLHKPSTPFGRTDDGLPGNEFVITNETGDVLPYKGSGPGYWGPVRLSHFVVVPPGESVHKEVNLSREYDFSKGGRFKIRFFASLDREPDARAAPEEERRAFVRTSQTFVQSNEIEVRVNTPSAYMGPSPSVSDICSTEDMEKINETLPSAANASQSGYGFILSVYQVIKDPEGNFSYRYNAKPRFERWFGRPPEDAPLPDQSGWYESDSGNLKSALGATMSRLTLTGGSKITPRCGCDGFPSEVMAQAEDHSPYLIHFCPGFFRLPVNDPWVSRTSVLIHEVSHFYDRDSDGRSDYVYGKLNAEDLARDDRWKAVRNADNVEFFMMDTTPYND